jgi:hypothetical protein
MADMAAAWMECTNLSVLQKKVEPRQSPGLCCFMGVFEGCFGKVVVFWLVFCGEVVVNCVVNRGGLQGCFWALRTCHKS